MRILTIISNFNEEKEILNCIRDFRENSTIESDLLVVDNWSTDSSVQLIESAGVAYIRHPVNTGGCVGVIKTGLLYSYLKDYDIYCQMDGDNQHHASELKTIVDPIIHGDADIVIGSRFLTKEGFQSLPMRRIGIWMFSGLLSKLTHQKITDVTSGFRAHNKRAIRLFAQRYKHQFEPGVHMTMLASIAGLKITEVPVLMKPRLTGTSEFTLVKSIKFSIYSFILIIATLLQKKQIMELLNDR